MWLQFYCVHLQLFDQFNLLHCACTKLSCSLQLKNINQGNKFSVHLKKKKKIYQYHNDIFFFWVKKGAQFKNWIPSKDINQFWRIFSLDKTSDIIFKWSAYKRSFGFICETFLQKSLKESCENQFENNYRHASDLEAILLEFAYFRLFVP